MRNEGFPKNVYNLFIAPKKNDVCKIAAEMVITGHELARAIFNSAQVGFKHSREHNWFYPESVTPTDGEKSAFSNSRVGPIMDKRAKKFIAKLGAQIRERKYISAHLFERGDEWHIIYFDFEDRRSIQDKNHWKGGNHVHYISYLWGKDVRKGAGLEQIQR